MMMMVMVMIMKLKCRFASTETVGLLGTAAQDGHLDFHTAPELWMMIMNRRLPRKGLDSTMRDGCWVYDDDDGDDDSLSLSLPP